jgi:AraC family transcriptional regulator, transcriptional activator of pobA
MASQLLIKDKIETERMIKVAPFKKEIRKTNPHKHNNYFEIIYLSNGSGYHYIDMHKYAITPPVIFFIRQEQVHYWQLNSEPDGYVIIIKKAFVEKSVDGELKLLLTKCSSQCCLQVPDNNTIQKLLVLLTEENKVSGENLFQITEGLLKSLLAKMLEVSKPVINNAEIKSDLYQSFVQLLSAANGIKNKVAFYAEILHTSPQNLNAACQKIVHKAAVEVLSEFVLIEAKRLLLYTDKTVSEIAFTLGFRDPSHFVKYFKKLAALTPQTFRLEND